MQNPDDENRVRLEQARALVTHLEHGDESQAARMLEELTRSREQNLFQELGRLTRELHETMNSFRLDSRIASIAEHEFPDAKERLNYVITMTEQAAHRTLDLVEQSLPVAEQMDHQAAALREAWERFRQRRMQADEFRELSRSMGGFLGSVAQDCATLHSNLSEVLMAQGYQDLTGQIIRRVIRLVQEVEDSLVEMVRISGSHMLQGVTATVNDAEVLEGPRIPGLSDAAVVEGQDEVDALLSSLGF